MMRGRLPYAVALAVFRPFERFLRTETRSGTLLLAATVAALLLANSSASEAYNRLWETPLGLVAGDFGFSLPLHVWINDVLMSLFFLNVGLEIKRELLIGELATARKAALPVLAAAGGMVAPALVYQALGGEVAPTGWGVPMATDIAFSLGIARLAGPHVGLLVFLTAFAIIDDLGAVIVIAAFYGGVVAIGPLLQAFATLGVLAAMAALGIRAVWPWLVVGVPLWIFVHDSGIHATVAGVALGFCVPASTGAPRNRAIELARGVLDSLRSEPHETEAALEALESHANRAQSPLTNLSQMLHPWVAFVILPLFALANAGVDLRGLQLGPDAAPAAIGVAVGLVVGKPVGILLASVLGVKLGVAELPDGVGWRGLAGAALLGGIGFTMALFVAQLAFAHDAVLLDAAKIGILCGSTLSAALGWAWLVAARTSPEPRDG